ncbi:hypothetical protein [Companilactobacillus hulinensis]|uniref:hypothetical protein n=1 Tax=Companilactobacillus hulinensis TaxID=2486007 RepID=UPI000F7A50B2|nr:hypothetical protein [Companilactobacillus hulinensis]
MTNILLTTLKFIAFFLSTWGYVSTAKRYTKVDRKLIWVMVFCGNILVLYAFAYFKLLNLAANVMFGLGLILFLVSFILNLKYRTWHFPIQLHTLWMLFYGAMLGTTLLSAHLEHYDNFSHWAVIVKFLYTQGRLPGAADTIISFTSYPMGSSLFVYYVTHIVGFEAGNMLFAQFILLFSCMVAMFAVIRDESRALITMMMCTMITLFNYFNIAIRMNNLLVDFVIPMLSIAAISGIYRYRNQIGLMTLHAAMLGAVIGIIKNNGIIFSVIVIGYYAYEVFHNSKTMQAVIKSTISLIFMVTETLAPIMIWNSHVKSTFKASKHEVSIKSYETIFGDKSMTIVHKIIHKYVSSIFSFSSLSTKGIILVNLILLITFFIIKYRIKHKTHALKALIAIDITIILYYVGILLMFLVSMPTPEALQLAGFERYASSIVILALGAVAMVLAQELDASLYEQNIMLRNYRSYKTITSKKIYQYTSMGLIFIATLMALSENNGIRYNEKLYSKTEPSRVSKMTGNNMKLNHTRYLIVSTDAADVNSYLTAYVGKYYLFTPNVDAKEFFVMDDDQFVAMLKGYDKVVILKKHFTFNAMTEKIYHKKYGPGIYSTKQILDQKEFVKDANN